MTSTWEKLHWRFRTLPLLYNVSPEDRNAYFNALAAKYGQAHRAYHVLTHIEFCFEVFDMFRHLAKDPDALELAIFYHDHIYNIGVPARQNEEKSALHLVLLMVMWGCPSAQVYNSMSAVLATAHDHTPSTNDNKLIVDIDLAGLGAPWPVFLQNNLNIREEYKHVPEDAFREGNGKILQRFLDRTPLYYHPEIEARYGAQAKDNLRRWLARP